VEEILKTALLGTAKHRVGPSADHPLDRMIGQLAEASADRELLLRAGSWSTYQLAGYQPQPSSETLEPAPEENQPKCSARAADIIKEFLEHKQPALLEEAFVLLSKTSQRLPPRILPDVLEHYSHSQSGQTSDLLKVLGQRGRWLCQFNEKWRKILSQLSEAKELPANAEALWNEGSPSERKSILSKVRSVDPPKSRQWLEAVWAAEKADARAEFLEILEAGLSAQDQTFLEGILADGSKRVRSTAGRLLCRLPESGTAQRVRRLGESMLAFSPPKSVGRIKSLVRSVTGKSDAGKLIITPPQEFDKGWEKDGMQEKPPPGTGKREFWMTQVMERIPPSHWEDHFHVPVAQLIAAAAEDDFGIALLTAWSKAAQYFQCGEWLSALSDFWVHWDDDKKKSKEHGIAQSQLLELLAAMPPGERETRILPLIEKPTPENSMLVCRTLESLPRPWSESLVRTFISAARRVMLEPTKEPALTAAWSSALNEAAAGIPSSCFDEALEPWEISETDDYAVRVCRKAVEEFTETVRLRRDFHQAVSSK